MQGGSHDAGLGGEVGGGDRGRGGADRDVPVALVGVGERGQCGCLAGSGVADDADAIRTRADGAEHRTLLAAERPLAFADDLEYHKHLSIAEADVWRRPARRWLATLALGSAPCAGWKRDIPH